MSGLARRGLLGAMGRAGAIALAAGPALAACSRPDPGSTSTPTTPEEQTVPVTTGPATAPTTLLVYFSRAGENYWEGGRRDLEIGNTQVIAEMIAERLPCRVHEILAADPYPDSYDETVRRNQQEQQEDARPAIDGDLPSLEGIDTILLGSPVWNTRAPMIMRTFLEQTGGLPGMTIRPFLTYAVGEGSVVADYEELCPEARVEDGLALRGEEARDSADAVADWLATFA
ncbi:hypothetical protein GCM10009592_22280 [Brachybacterium rhamnosum]|uniref:Flavodoxin n=1 Tax=Brachybacterium rhamnosum TaxID=173361 RepID=A0ABW4PYK6_9MICO